MPLQTNLADEPDKIIKRADKRVVIQK